MSALPADAAGHAMTPGEHEPLDALLERALRGDAEALEVFFTLLKTRYGRLFLRRLQSRGVHAQAATLEDILQQSLLQLMEEIKNGAVPDLLVGERRDILAYFQKLCDRNLRAHQEKKRSLRKHEEPELDKNATRDRRIEPADLPPDEQLKKAEHLALLRVQVKRLSAFDRDVLDDYLSDIPYAEIARKTGKSVNALGALVYRLKRHLTMAMARVSKTARLFQQQPAPSGDPATPPTSVPETPGATPSFCPDAREIREAVDQLPKESCDAVTFVHLNGGTEEAYARTLGERGAQKARVRLKRGCASLSLQLHIPFPESFSLLSDV